MLERSRIGMSTIHNLIFHRMALGPVSILLIPGQGRMYFENNSFRYFILHYYRHGFCSTHIESCFPVLQVGLSPKYFEQTLTEISETYL